MSQDNTLPAQASEIATRIGPYRLLKILGEGGMGLVWQAEQTSPVRRYVALKLIKYGHVSKDILARFEAERQALALMDHPNIAKVLDGGTTDKGQPFFVMELVKGVPITAFCDDNKLSIRDRLKLFIDVCKAVQHAHQKGIIHRDLKPGNVLVTFCDGKPVPKVIDFGLAKAIQQPLTDRTLVTEFGSVMGTPEYMAPEQANPDAFDIDTRADVYSLGVILFELLTGTVPFSRKLLKTTLLVDFLRLVRDEEAPSPSKKFSTVGSLMDAARNRQSDPRQLPRLLKGELDWVTLKCLEKDRSRRYESLSALVSDVQCYLDDEPVQARPPHGIYLLRKYLKRNKILIGATAAVIIALLCGGAVAGWKWSEAIRDRKLAEDMADKAITERKRADSQALVASNSAQKAEEQARLAGEKSIEALNQQLRADQQAKRADINAAQANERLREQRRLLDMMRIRRAGEAFDNDNNSIVRSLDLLNEVEEGNETGIGNRTIAWSMMRRYCEGSDWTMYGHTDSVRAVDWSHDGKTIASASDDFTVRLWDAATGIPGLVLKGHTYHVYSVSWSPDGSTLVSGGADMTLRVWNAATGECKQILKGHSGHVNCVAFSPDGRMIASAGRDKTVRLWNSITGNEVVTIKGHSENVNSVAWSPDGKNFVSGSDDKTLRVCNADTGRTDMELNCPGGRVYSVAWSPDGRTIASGNQFESITLWDSVTGQERKNLKGPSNSSAYYCINWSPDGRKIASVGMDQSVRIWDGATGLAGPVFKGNQQMVRSVVWSPDGRTLVTGGDDQSLRIWEVERGKSRSIFKSHKAGIRGFALSPDAAIVASSDYSEKKVDLSDLQTAKIIMTLQGHTQTVNSIAWSPDGRSIATGSDDKQVILWNASDGKPIKILNEHQDKVGSVEWSPDGKYVASGSQDGTIRIWNVSANRLERVLIGHTKYFAGITTPYIHRIAWSPDGKTLASAGNEVVRLWNSGNGLPMDVIWLSRHSTVDLPIFDIAWSPNGKRLSTANFNKTVWVYDVESSIPHPILFGHSDKVFKVAWNPDGRTIASGGYDNTIRISDADSGETGIILSGHTARITGLAWSPDGRTLFSASDDKTIRIWSGYEGQAVHVFSGHNGYRMQYSWSPDGRMFATRSSFGDGRIRIWDSVTRNTKLVMAAHSRDSDFRYCKNLWWSKDGLRLVSEADVLDPSEGSLGPIGINNRRRIRETVVLDALTGERINDSAIPKTIEYFQPDNGWQLIPYRDRILMVSKHIPEREINWRKSMMSPRPDYHREQSIIAEKNQQIFAAIFHLRRLLFLESENKDAKSRLAALEAKHVS